MVSHASRQFAGEGFAAAVTGSAPDPGHVCRRSRARSSAAKGRQPEAKMSVDLA